MHLLGRGDSVPFGHQAGLSSAVSGHERAGGIAGAADGTGHPEAGLAGRLLEHIGGGLDRVLQPARPRQIVLTRGMRVGVPE